MNTSVPAFIDAIEFCRPQVTDDERIAARHERSIDQY
jgi:hypothetical protein